MLFWLFCSASLVVVSVMALNQYLAKSHPATPVEEPTPWLLSPEWTEACQTAATLEPVIPPPSQIVRGRGSVTAESLPQLGNTSAFGRSRLPAQNDSTLTLVR